MIVLGIDPGAAGGIVRHFGGVTWAHKMPATERDIWDLIRWGGADRAFIEKVHSMPGQGVSSTFKFGQNYGFLRGCLIAAGIPFESVSPTVWQREFGLIKRKGETLTEKKNRHKAAAQEFFPQIKMTHALADALLIALYGYRLRNKESE